MRRGKASKRGIVTRLYGEEKAILDSLTPATLLHVPFIERTGNTLQVYSGYSGIGAKQITIDHLVENLVTPLVWDTAEAMRGPNYYTDTDASETIDDKNFYQNISAIPSITSGHVVWYFCTEFVPCAAGDHTPKAGITPVQPYGITLDIQTEATHCQIIVADRGTGNGFAKLSILAADPNYFPTLGLVAGSVSFTIGQPGVFLRLDNGTKTEIEVDTVGGSYSFNEFYFYAPDLPLQPSGLRYSFRKNIHYGQGVMCFQNHVPTEQEYFDHLTWIKAHYPKGNKTVWPYWANRE